MFLHGGFLHILGNMWFLWIFGGAVEDRLGPVSYLLFYFICGIGSGLAQALFSWGSSLPSIGASGAISGVLGAYVVFFPSSRILTLVPLFVFFFTAQIPAIIFIGLWFVDPIFQRSERAETLRAGRVWAESRGGPTSAASFWEHSWQKFLKAAVDVPTAIPIVEVSPGRGREKSSTFSKPSRDCTECITLTLRGTECRTTFQSSLSFHPHSSPLRRAPNP